MSRRRRGVVRLQIAARRHSRATISRALAGIAWLLLGLVADPALALKPITVDPETERIEITGLRDLHDYYDGRGDNLQVETAPGPDGATGRMSVRAKTAGINPGWIVFALRNATDKPLERWITAERYNLVGSGVVWPDLDARRLEALTPSVGFVPERIRSDRADIFRITLEPGQIITYVAELASDSSARVYLWKPLEYEQKTRDRQLFNGIMLGITGLLAIFLTAIFAANHKAIFPAAALVTWCALAYLCVEFGFWHKLFQMRPENNAQYRAAGEAAVAASLVIFLFVFLRISRWRSIFRLLFGFWIAAQLVLVALAVVDPRLAATFARLSFIGIAGVGGLFILALALRGQDRALALVTPWIFLGVWVFAAGVTLTGRLAGDVVVSSLVAGLVLIGFLIGFMVTQFAFRAHEPLFGAAPDQQQLRSLAVEGAGAAVWEWSSRRDEIKAGPTIEATLGLGAGDLSCKTETFAGHLHAADRERFRLALWSLQERKGGELRLDFRMRNADSTYRWFEIEASSMPSSDSRTIRCVGLMRDITDAKRAQERLLHDAVHDSLTGLPNRELFLDRLQGAFMRAKAEPKIQPTVIFIDIDKFKSVNSSLGLMVGDSLLLTVARRVQRHLEPTDTLARIGGDQFAMLLVAEQPPPALAALAERVRRTIRTPINIAGQEIVLTGSLGIAIRDGSEASHQDLLKEAEIAMHRARRQGADQIEIFKPQMRDEPDGRVSLESDLRRALDKSLLAVQFQPIVYLPTEEIAGFEALVRWEHPRLGQLNPAEFVPLAEESDLILRLGSFVLGRAVLEAQRWQKELPRQDRPLFVSVNISSRQLIRQDLLAELRLLLAKAQLAKGSIKLEITESLVMENPEQATRMLELLRDAGVDLSLDDFGTGYSSLAYLQRFPFDTIKIDRALVQSSGRDIGGPGGAIVRSIVALAHELDRKVVAEGVEEAEDVSFLRALDCEFAQGYYYGPPMSANDALGLLKQIRKQERKLKRRAFFQRKPKAKPGEPIAATPAAAPLPAIGARPAAARPATQAPRDGKEPVTAPTRPPTAPPALPVMVRTGRPAQPRPMPPAPGRIKPRPQEPRAVPVMPAAVPPARPAAARPVAAGAPSRASMTLPAAPAQWQPPAAQLPFETPADDAHSDMFPPAASLAPDPTAPMARMPPGTAVVTSSDPRQPSAPVQVAWMPRNRTSALSPQLAASLARIAGAPITPPAAADPAPPADEHQPQRHGSSGH